MATSTFGATGFRVFGDGSGFFPLPVRDNDGIPHYRASIHLASDADYAAMQDALSIVSVRRALGSFGFVATVEAGPASADLVVPIGAGTLGTFRALLVGLTPKASGSKATDMRADADWLLVSDDLTP